MTIIPVMLTSCGGEQKETESNESSKTDSLEFDTLIVEEVIPERISYDVNKLLARIDTVYSLPFIVDSIMLDSLFEDIFFGSDLSNAEVQYLGFSYPKDSPSSSSAYCINEFIEIDSIKMRDEYDKYLEDIDLGQTADAVANLVGQVKVSKNEYYILWTTAYHSYEACPYGHGSYIWATYFKDNEPYEAVLVGEYSGGSDAPYWMATTLTSTITKKGIESFSVTENAGEDDDSEEEVIEISKKWTSYKLNAENAFDVEERDKK